MTGKVYQRRGLWWIKYRARGREVRESVARILDKAPAQVSRHEAEAVLDERMHRRKLIASSVGAQRRVAFTADDVVVGTLVRSLCLPGPVIFNGSDMRSLLGPGVYAYFVAGEPIYVGSSIHGLARAMSPTHHALGRLKRQESEHLVMWPAATAHEARAIESKLIAELRPTANRAAIRTPALSSFVQGEPTDSRLKDS